MARPRPDSPACAPPTAALRLCARPPRSGARQPETRNGERETGSWAHVRETSQGKEAGRCLRPKSLLWVAVPETLPSNLLRVSGTAPNCPPIEIKLFTLPAPRHHWCWSRLPLCGPRPLLQASLQRRPGAGPPKPARWRAPRGLLTRAGREARAHGTSAARREESANERPAGRQTPP